MKLSELPYELLTEISNYFVNSSTVFSLMLVSKEFYEFLLDHSGYIEHNYGKCCKNVKYLPIFEFLFDYKKIKKFMKRFTISIFDSSHFVSRIVNFKGKSIAVLENLLLLKNKFLIRKERMKKRTYLFKRKYSDYYLKRVIIKRNSIKHKWKKFPSIIDEDETKRNLEIGVIDSNTFVYLFELKDGYFHNCDHINDRLLKYMRNCRTLKISFCKNVTDKGLKYLSNIQELNISSVKNITDNGLRYLNNVYKLDISYCSKITDDGLKYLGKVRELNLTLCKSITDCGLKFLKNVHKLDISLCGANITDEGLKYLVKVRELDLEGCTRITDCGLKFLKNVDTLSIAYNITDIGLKYLSKVKVLSIKYSNQITDNGLKYLYNLHTLDISKCFQITWKGINHLSRIHSLFIEDNAKMGHLSSNIPSIHHLIIDECNITDDELSYLSNVRILEVKWCPNFTGKCLKSLKDLIEIKIDFCKSFCNEGMKCITSLPRVRYIGVWSSLIKERDIKRILSGMKYCEIYFSNDDYNGYINYRSYSRINRCCM